MAQGCVTVHNLSYFTDCARVESTVMDDSDSGLASSRERRNNAGARMSRLLDAEDDDDFYKTTYGGFTEVGVALSEFLRTGYLPSSARI